MTEEQEEIVVMVSYPQKSILEARKALEKAIHSERAKYNPSVGLLEAYKNGLRAIGGNYDELPKV